MMMVMRYVAVLAAVSFISFFAGRLAVLVSERFFPGHFFCADHFPYCPHSFEREGRIYEAFGVRAWKDRLPDMSRILRAVSGIIPEKNISARPDSRSVGILLRETCVAEWVHGCLALFGLGCALLWRSRMGWVLGVLYALGNLPFVIIQRYNRPKLLRLHHRLLAREGGGEQQAPLSDGEGDLSYGECQTHQ